MSLSINIIAGINAAVSSVSTSGHESHILTKQEEKIFKIDSKDTLKNIAENVFGRKPFEVFLHKPTTFNDMYRKNMWNEVQTHLIIKNAVITNFQAKPVIVETKYFANQSRIKAQFNANISATVTNTIETNWSTANMMSFDQAFNYGIQFNGGGLGGNSNFHYEHTWGKGGSSSMSTSIGSSAGISIELEPGESVIAELIASKGTMKVKVNYETYLDGDLATRYFWKLNGSHHWAIPIDKAMKQYGLASSREISEEILVDYYSNSSVILKDAMGNLMKILYLDNQGNVMQVQEYRQSKTKNN